MKSKYLLFLFSLVSCFNISAQEFAPYGSEWHYSNTTMGDTGYTTMKCIDTALIDGKICSVLETNQTCNYLSGEVIVYSTANGDSVFWYEPNSEEFQLIYAFDAQPGESWSFAVVDNSTGELSNADSVIVIVNSVDSINVNGLILPKLDINYTWVWEHDQLSYSTSIVKHIGSMMRPFDFPEFLSLCHLWPIVNGLRCYEDSYLGFYETGIADSCTHEKTGTFVNELKTEETVVKLFPNPVTQTLNISLQNGTLRSLVIYDLSGREVFSKTVNDKNQLEHQINLSLLPAGAYMVKIDTQNKSVVKKLIKQ